MHDPSVVLTITRPSYALYSQIKHLFNYTFFTQMLTYYSDPESRDRLSPVSLATQGKMGGHNTDSDAHLRDTEI